MRKQKQNLSGNKLPSIRVFAGTEAASATLTWINVAGLACGMIFGAGSKQAHLFFDAFASAFIISGRSIWGIRRS